MKRREFIKAWTHVRESRLRAMVKAGTMRPSEAVMNLMDVEKDAAKLWRKHHSTWKSNTVEEFYKVMRLELGVHPPKEDA